MNYYILFKKILHNMISIFKYYNLLYNIFFVYCTMIFYKVITFI